MSSEPPARTPGPIFDEPIPPGGYRWWHVDAESDDGQHGITVAAFLGSSFAVRGTEDDRSGRGAVLACLRGCGGPRWSMTRRGGDEIMRWPRALVIGLNTVFWSGTALSLGIDDVTAPLPGRIRGVVHVHLAALPDHRIPLDAPGLHRWRPFAPCARVSVAMERPACAWEGVGWADAHEGDVPLDETFLDWSRSRTRPGGTSVVMHELRLRDGGIARAAYRVDAAGGIERCETERAAALPPTRWRLERRVPADTGAARIIATLADTPLYARTLAEAPLHGEQARILHETLSFERLRRGWGRLLLSMRSPPAWI